MIPYSIMFYSIVSDCHYPVACTSDERLRMRYICWLLGNKKRSQPLAHTTTARPLRFQIG